ALPIYNSDSRYAWASATVLKPWSTCTSSSRTRSSLLVAPAIDSRKGCLYLVYTLAAAGRSASFTCRVTSRYAMVLLLRYVVNSSAPEVHLHGRNLRRPACRPRARMHP